MSPNIYHTSSTSSSILHCHFITHRRNQCSIKTHHKKSPFYINWTFTWQEQRFSSELSALLCAGLPAGGHVMHPKDTRSQTESLGFFTTWRCSSAHCCVNCVNKRNGWNLFSRAEHTPVIKELLHWWFVLKRSSAHRKNVTSLLKTDHSAIPWTVDEWQEIITLLIHFISYELIVRDGNVKSNRLKRPNSNSVHLWNRIRSD